jgi:hypothetical protein
MAETMAMPSQSSMSAWSGIGQKSLTTAIDSTKKTVPKIHIISIQVPSTNVKDKSDGRDDCCDCVEHQSLVLLAFLITAYSKTNDEVCHRIKAHDYPPPNRRFIIGNVVEGHEAQEGNHCDD